MIEAFPSGSVALFRSRLVLTCLRVHLFSLYIRIQIGFEIVLDTGTETEFWDLLKMTGRNILSCLVRFLWIRTFFGYFGIN